jgi:sugar/nucleoside kinase (ribokinase family)
MNYSLSSKPILCVGDLVVDIISSPVNKLPDPSELILTDGISIFPGGNALNIAVALAKMGSDVRIAGSIGDDFLGKLLLKQIVDLNIDTSSVECVKNEMTASTLILLQKGEDRRFISALGVTEKFSGANLSEEIIPVNGVVVIGGYLKLFNWDDELLIKFLKTAKARGNKTILNISFLENSNVDPKRCLKILPYVDVFVPNENEAEIITDKRDISEHLFACLNDDLGEPSKTAKGHHVITQEYNML